MDLTDTAAIGVLSCDKESQIAKFASPEQAERQQEYSSNDGHLQMDRDSSAAARLCTDAVLGAESLISFQNDMSDEHSNWGEDQSHLGASSANANEYPLPYLPLQMQPLATLECTSMM